VRILTNCAIERVEKEGASIHVAGQTESFDGAVLAVPPRVALELYQLDDEMRAWLGAVRYATSGVLALVLTERIRADYFGISIPRGLTASDLVAICVQQQKSPELVPADRSLLVCLGAPYANDSLIEHPEQGVERMIAAAEHVLPGTRARIAHAKLYRHTYGYPIFYPGYLRHLRNFPRQRDNIVLAGDYLVAPTVEGAVRSGERSARVLFDQLRAVA
jgi:protoporphyrinogen/coproporphyrinogen III oxidase